MASFRLPARVKAGGNHELALEMGNKIIAEQFKALRDVQMDGRSFETGTRSGSSLKIVSCPTYPLTEAEKFILQPNPFTVERGEESKKDKCYKCHEPCFWTFGICTECGAPAPPEREPPSIPSLINDACANFGGGFSTYDRLDEDVESPWSPARPDPRPKDRAAAEAQRPMASSASSTQREQGRSSSFWLYEDTGVMVPDPVFELPRVGGHLGTPVFYLGGTARGTTGGANQGRGDSRRMPGRGQAHEYIDSLLEGEEYFEDDRDEHEFW